MSNTDFIVLITKNGTDAQIVFCTNDLKDAQRFCAQFEVKHHELTIYKARETYQG